MTWSERGVLAAIVALGLLAVVVIVRDYRKQVDWDKRCLSAGGTPFRPLGGRICIAADRVVQVP